MCGECWWGYCDRGGTGMCHTFIGGVWHCRMPGGNCPIGHACFVYKGEKYYKQKPATPCPIDGGVSDWSKWGECSVTCEGSGYRMRTRSCTNPAPAHGGKQCTEKMYEKQNCANPQPCPIDGGVSAWSAWGKCSTTCGNGKQIRARTCTNPKPEHGGRPCDDHMQETKVCVNADLCPVQGGWGDWQPWQPCTRTCGPAIQRRRRNCNNPPPSNGGKECMDMPFGQRNCDNPDCTTVV